MKIRESWRSCIAHGMIARMGGRGASHLESWEMSLWRWYLLKTSGFWHLLLLIITTSQTKRRNIFSLIFCVQCKAPELLKYCNLPLLWSSCYFSTLDIFERDQFFNCYKENCSQPNTRNLWNCVLQHVPNFSQRSGEFLMKDFDKMSGRRNAETQTALN